MDSEETEKPHKKNRIEQNKGYVHMCRILENGLPGISALIGGRHNVQESRGSIRDCFALINAV